MSSRGDAITVPKRDADREVVRIPDLVIKDTGTDRAVIFNLEGKKHATAEAGVKEVQALGAFENFIAEAHPGVRIERGLVLAGGSGASANAVVESTPGVVLALQEDGAVYVAPGAPRSIVQGLAGALAASKHV